MTKYDVIVSDPPWSFNDRLQKMKSPTKRSAISQYKVMSPGDISRLDVPSITNPEGCVLALWVPSTMLAEGLKVIDAWGYRFKTTYVWVKQTKKGKLAFGMGRLFRASHEIALIATVGKVYGDMQDHSQRSVSMAPNDGHSIKPATLQDSLDLMYPGTDKNKLEMFARRNRVGWTCIGDAVTGKDIKTSIEELKLI
jgi:N6-adenosine-specific RNA methylase IME4